MPNVPVTKMICSLVNCGRSTSSQGLHVDTGAQRKTDHSLSVQKRIVVSIRFTQMRVEHLVVSHPTAAFYQDTDHQQQLEFLAKHIFAGLYTVVSIPASHSELLPLQTHRPHRFPLKSSVTVLISDQVIEIMVYSEF